MGSLTNIAPQLIHSWHCTKSLEWKYQHCTEVGKVVKYMLNWINKSKQDSFLSFFFPCHGLVVPLLTCNAFEIHLLCKNWIWCWTIFQQLYDIKSLCRFLITCKFYKKANNQGNIAKLWKVLKHEIISWY